jgi:hypothetical protein
MQDAGSQDRSSTTDGHQISPKKAEKFHNGAREAKGLFSWQNFWRNATVAVSLLFGKYCSIMV